MVRKVLRLPSGLKRLLLYLSILGPGLITASADNDAPGIATYSMAGSKYGYRFLWIILFITFGEVIVQEMAARMGAVTGKGAADLIRERFGVRITAFAMFCLLIGNLGTTLAQFAGVAASTELLGVTRYITVPLAALLVAFLVLRGSYDRVEKVLLLLCLASLSYVLTAFIVKPNWGEVARNTLVPSFLPDTEYILTVLATIGTTITPWGIFYMQASVADKGIRMDEYPLTRADVMVGAAWGNVVSGFIIITTSATLFKVGISVETAEQAAQALAPLAGDYARYLFTIGMLGASLLAASVLPLATAYAVCEAFGWERGLNQKIEDAPIFYTIYLGFIIISVLVVLIPGLPLFRVMMLSQSLNAILLPVLLVLVIKLVNDRRIMHGWANRRWQNVLAIILTVMISLVTLALFVLTFLGIA